MIQRYDLKLKKKRKERKKLDDIQKKKINKI